MSQRLSCEAHPDGAWPIFSIPTLSDLARYQRDPVAFIDRFITRNELGQPFVLVPHQREVLSCMFQFDSNGRLPFDTLVYSGVKKSG
jgi:hypothetical protein